MIDVSLAPCTSYDRDEVARVLREALEPIGGLDWVKPGMKIGIKANLVAQKKPEAAATTHPALLCELTRMLMERGAEVIVGDSPGGIYNSIYVNRIYNAAGMKTVEAAGARLNQDFSEAEKDLPEAVIAKRITYTAWLDGVDAVINFCKLKTHAMMGMSAAAKNLFGTIPGTRKPEYHFLYPNPMDFARMLVDLNTAFPVRLCLVDGVVGMEGNGPTAGTPRKIGCVLASKDAHKLDVICARIIGLDPMLIPTLAAARERGLLPEDLSQITTDRPVEPFCIPDYGNIPNANHLMEQDGNTALWGGSANRLLKRFIASRPKLYGPECVGCGECFRLCPAKAITMVNGKPSIDRKKCICCFCCQEFCPKGAMRSYRPPLARLAGKL